LRKNCVRKRIKIFENEFKYATDSTRLLMRKLNTKIINGGTSVLVCVRKVFILYFGVFINSAMNINNLSARREKYGFCMMCQGCVYLVQYIETLVYYYYEYCYWFWDPVSYLIYIVVLGPIEKEK
jgi:hypothetical protein